MPNIQPFVPLFNHLVLNLDSVEPLCLFNAPLLLLDKSKKPYQMLQIVQLRLKKLDDELNFEHYSRVQSVVYINLCWE